MVVTCTRYHKNSLIVQPVCSKHGYTELKRVAKTSELFIKLVKPANIKTKNVIL